MASLQTDPSGNYHVKFRFGGRQFRRSLRTKMKRKAEAAASHVEENIRLILEGRMNLPSGADVPTFLLSDGKLAEPIKLSPDNVCVREDGTTGTFDGRMLFRRQMKMALGALFRTELSRQLEEIGLSTHRPDNDRGKPVSWFELKAVPKTVIQAFSKRREQIVNWLKDNGQSGAKASEKAALSTRQSKSHFSRDELKRAWRSAAKHFGLTSRTLTEQSVTLFPPDSSTEANNAAERGLDQLTNERGHFTETELIRYVAQEAQCHRVGSDQVLACVRETLQNESLIVPLQIVDGERHYTTHEILELEKALFAAAENSIGIDRHVVPNRTLATVITDHSTLRPEQAEAVRHITGKLGRIHCVNLPVSSCQFATASGTATHSAQTPEVTATGITMPSSLASFETSTSTPSAIACFRVYA